MKKILFLLVFLPFWAFGQLDADTYLARTAAGAAVYTGLQLKSYYQGGTWLVGGNTVSANSIIGNNANFDLIFRTNSTERMRITGVGNVGLGISANASDSIGFGSSATFSAPPNGTDHTRGLTWRSAYGPANGHAASIQNVVFGGGAPRNRLEFYVQKFNDANGQSVKTLAFKVDADYGNYSYTSFGAQDFYTDYSNGTTFRLRAPSNSPTGSSLIFSGVWAGSNRAEATISSIYDGNFGSYLQLSSGRTGNFNYTAGLPALNIQELNNNAGKTNVAIANFATIGVPLSGLVGSNNTSLLVRGAGNSTGTNNQIWQNSDQTELMKINNGGILTISNNVGIGITPSVKLDVNGVINVNVNKITSLANGTASNDAAAFGQIGTAVNTAINGTSGYVSKFTAANTIGNSSIVENATGVGIGAASPSVKLHVIATASQMARFTTTQNPNTWNTLQLYSDAISAGLLTANGMGWRMDDNSAKFYANNAFTNTMFDKFGNAAIGQTLSVIGATFLYSTLNYLSPPDATAYLQSQNNSQNSVLIANTENDGAVGIVSPTTLVNMSYLTRSDTLTAWAGRTWNVPGDAHDIYINSRTGSQANTDSIVFSFNFTPYQGHEINIYPQAAAKLWVMDVILANAVFDDYNAISTKFLEPTKRQCVEFGAAANNSNYNGDLFVTGVGKIWCIKLKWNHKDYRWLVTKIPYQ